MKLRMQSGEKGLVAETALLMARFEIDNGNLEQAEKLAQRAIDEFTHEKRSDEQATALATLAYVQLQQHDLEAARQAIHSAVAIARSTQDLGAGLYVELVNGQIEAVAGDPHKAVDELRDRVERIGRRTSRFAWTA
jgi:ATP/maltotriose-dependent transcriptional regulator MalT